MKNLLNLLTYYVKQIEKSCKHYWKGQLTRAICFCEILGLNPEELSDIKISDKQDGYTIRIRIFVYGRKGKQMHTIIT